MSLPQLSVEDHKAIQQVCLALSAAFEKAGMATLMPFFSDVSLNPFAVQMGVVQAHINGLATILAQFEDATRDMQIVGVPAQLHHIIARGKS